MSAPRQSLAEAVAAVRSGRIPLRCGLDGCPVGGWAETQQAILRLQDDLPRERSYSVTELVREIYTVDSAGRYRVRD